MQIIKTSSYKIMPWKNGQGVTAEIDRFPKAGAYLWRLSQATIASDGPFSTFAGFDRLLCVIKGDAILLNEKRLEYLEPLQFAGEENVLCKLTGAAVTDLGLVYDRQKIRAEMKIVMDQVVLEEGTHFIYDLITGETLKTEEPATLKISRSLLISIFQSPLSAKT